MTEELIINQKQSCYTERNEGKNLLSKNLYSKERNFCALKSCKEWAGYKRYGKTDKARNDSVESNC